MAEQRGTVKSIAANEATITMDDGSTAVVAVPEVIAVEVGMPVTVGKSACPSPS